MLLKFLSYTVCIVGFACFSLPASAFTMSLKVAAIDWCPQICPNSNSKPGYIIETLNKVFEETEIKVEVDYFPWSRAIKNVREGTYLALLAPAKQEAPELKFPKHPIGLQRMCFFTLQNVEWLFTDISSLNGKRVGIAKDSSIEELNAYITQNAHQFQFQPYHERYVIQNINKLVKDRIDTFIFTRNSTHYLKQRNSDLPDIREAGCVSEAPVYFALSPVHSLNSEIKQIVAQFELNMQKIIISGELDRILARYHTGFTANDLANY